MEKILILALFCSTLIFGQITDNKTTKPASTGTYNTMLIARPAQLCDTISGTPFVKETFAPAKVND